MVIVLKPWESVEGFVVAILVDFFFGGGGFCLFASFEVSAFLVIAVCICYLIGFLFFKWFAI